MAELPSLKEAILTRFGRGAQVAEAALARAIRSASRVADRRAVRDRIEALVSDGFLERLPPGGLYRVAGLEAG